MDMTPETKKQIVVYKDGSYKEVDGDAFEYNNDPDWLTTIKLEYGEKQSPRWVKAGERLPNEPGRYHVWMKMLENGSEFSTTVNFTLGCWEVEDEMFEVTKWLDESESPGSQEAVESILSKLVDIRNKLYNSLPTGEINAWDLLQMVKWHINDLDGLCSRIKVTV